jgi:hypothetical protein
MRRDKPGGSLKTQFKLIMVVEEPFALFITWTCYGTWLPGDPRGYVSDTLQPGNARIPKNNVPGTDYSAGHEFTRKIAKQRQKSETVYLTQAQARLAADNFLETARSRDWRILRAAVMRNHIHLVVADSPDDGPGVRRILKGNAQANSVRHWDIPGVGGLPAAAIVTFMAKKPFAPPFDM